MIILHHFETQSKGCFYFLKFQGWFASLKQMLCFLFAVAGFQSLVQYNEQIKYSEETIKYTNDILH